MSVEAEKDESSSLNLEGLTQAPPVSSASSVSPYQTPLEKLEYCKTRFKDWKCFCYKLPWVGSGFGERPLFGYVIVQDPSGFTLIGDVDLQRPRYGDGDLGVRFNRGSEITFGIGPNPYDTYAFMWWAREHWAYCEHRQVGVDTRMGMMLAASGKYHEGTLNEVEVLKTAQDRDPGEFFREGTIANLFNLDYSF